MADFNPYREGSRTNWGTYAEKLTLEQINTGALLRIADASEKMALRHTELMNERDRLQRDNDRLRKRVDFLERSRASLRGHLKRQRERT